jgi:glycosyltransferase involved in cell wall biosynthesis
VLLQGYPNLEYFIIDGGSSDGTVDIIRKYEPWLAGWVSEPDRGQGHAINKGFSQATGDILAWLNSDDLYTPGALQAVAEMHRAHPAAIVAGDVVDFNHETGEERLFEHRNVDYCNVVRFWEGRSWHQPGLFFPREAYPRTNGLDESLRYTMDYDLLCRLLRLVPVVYVNDVVARFRRHGSAKSARQAGVGFLLENTLVSQRYWHLLPPEERAGCELGLTRRLVRRAARKLILEFRPTHGLSLLRAAWRVSKNATLINLVSEVIHLGRAGSQKGS